MCIRDRAVTAPTAGVLTKAATVSLEVSIFKPVLGEDVDTVIAAWAARVSPMHVTVTDPAGSELPEARVRVTAFDINKDEVEIPVGEDKEHGLVIAEVTRP